MDKKATFVKYLNDLAESSKLQDQIVRLELEEDYLEQSLEIVSEELDKNIYNRLHEVRVEIFGLKLKLNSLERETLQFELNEELAK